MPFDRGELLREAGYSEGDFLSLFFEGDSASNSSTSDSYTNYVGNRLDPHLEWDTLLPSKAQAQVAVVARGDPGSDQLDIRVRNLTDNETVVEETGVAGGIQFIPIEPTDYTPATTADPIRLQIEFRNNDNATQVSIFGGYISIGVKVE